MGMLPGVGFMPTIGLLVSASLSVGDVSKRRDRKAAASNVRMPGFVSDTGKTVTPL